MNRTQIYLPKTQLNILRKIAQKKKTSVSEVIRIFLKEKIEKVHPRPLFREKLFEAAKRINALGKKGPGDLAKKMDFYLYGKK